MIAVCKADVALVLDVSSSVGERSLMDVVEPLVLTIFRQLQRLPAGPGDDSFDTQLLVVMFNEDSTLYDIKSISQSETQILKAIQNTFKQQKLGGGSCISCGLDMARKVLQEKGESGLKEAQPKYVHTRIERLDS